MRLRSVEIMPMEFKDDSQAVGFVRRRMYGKMGMELLNRIGQGRTYAVSRKETEGESLAALGHEIRLEVEVDEIVRCEDCTRSALDGCGNLICDEWSKPNYTRFVQPDGFCSKGERGTDAD